MIFLLSLLFGAILRRLVFLAALLLVAALLMPTPALADSGPEFVSLSIVAQDATPTPEGPADPPLPPEPVDEFDPDNLITPTEVIEQLVLLLGLFAVGAGFVAEPFTALFKALIARYSPERLHLVPYIALAMPVIVTVLYWITNALGVSAYYESFLRAVGAAIPHIVSIIGAVAGQSVAYKVLKSTDAPIIGQDKVTLAMRGMYVRGVQGVPPEG